MSNDDAAKNGAFKSKYNLSYDLLCDTTTAVTKALGVYGPQEWKGEKYDGLTRSTIVVGKDGTIKGILQGIKAEDHAAEALKLLRG